MVDRLVDLTGYRRVSETSKIYSYIGDPMLPISRDTDELLKKIDFLLGEMKSQRQTYQRSTTTASENRTFTDYRQKQRQCRKHISQVKENIKQLQQLAQNSPKDSEEYQNRHKESAKYLYRLKECLQTQINQDKELNVTVQRKKEKFLGMVPKGLKLEDIEGGKYSPEVKNAASDLLAKLDELEKLAASINECVRMMEDIQFLVIAQREKISEVGVNIKQALYWLDKADKHLAVQVERQSSGMKKKCLLLLLAVIVAAVAVFILYKTGVF